MRCIRILFVCLGNTCRSPMAETIMRALCRELGLAWIIDSAALRSWNVGRYPDERCIKVLEENGLSTDHYTRMVNWEDFQTFDYIICMDESNINELKAMSEMVDENCKAKIQHLALYSSNKNEKTIKDPFCTVGLNCFNRTFNQISSCCRRLLNAIQ
uniref:Low molecular weight phosphotyrosine protein phosphatase n=1 Tax=Glossina brevipalpis TaxID=37001 RepID=A0A1A9WDJ9_9MUSC